MKRRSAIAFGLPIPYPSIVTFPTATALLVAALTATARAQAKPAPPAPSAKAPEASAPAEAPDPAKAIRRLDGSRFELNGIIFDKKSRAISLPAKVNMSEGLLEYALVHESGKVHESLLSTAVSPFDLNVVLLLLNYQPCEAFFDLSNKEAGAVPVKNPVIGVASQLQVSVEWKDSGGSAKSAALESLLLNLDQKNTVTPGSFTYTGSQVRNDGSFLAQDTGSILALYVDAASVINNPREGNENDDIWVPDQKKVPARDTLVTVLLKPVESTEKKAAQPEVKPALPGGNKRATKTPAK